MGKPHVAIVAADLDLLGGQGVQARWLAEALRADGFRVTFVPINPRPPAALRWVRRLRYARTLVTEALYLAGLRRLRGADVVHVFTASYWSFLLAAVPALLATHALGAPVVLNYHSGEAADHLARWGAGVHPWLRRADRLVVPSEYLRGVFASFGYRPRVVPNLVPLARFRYRERSPLRPRLLSNRNLESHYRVERTIEAFALLRRRVPGAHLTIAGCGAREAPLRHLARAACGGAAEFVGRVEPAAMPALYDAHDVFVNSSVVDNQPLSVLEAQAAGLPVVSTGTGDIAAMLRGGAAGVLVPPEDPAAMADAVADLLERPGHALALARRGRDVVEDHAWPRIGRAWAELYEEVAG